MLTPEERDRAEGTQKSIARSKSTGKFPVLSAYDIEWLAEKVIELDDLANQLGEELYEAKRKLARRAEFD